VFSEKPTPREFSPVGGKTGRTARWARLEKFGDSYWPQGRSTEREDQYWHFGGSGAAGVRPLTLPIRRYPGICGASASRRRCCRSTGFGDATRPQELKGLGAESAQPNAAPLMRRAMSGIPQVPVHATANRPRPSMRRFRAPSHGLLSASFEESPSTAWCISRRNHGETYRELRRRRAGPGGATPRRRGIRRTRCSVRLNGSILPASAQNRFRVGRCPQCSASRGKCALTRRVVPDARPTRGATPARGAARRRSETGARRSNLVKAAMVADSSAT